MKSSFTNKLLKDAGNKIRSLVSNPYQRFGISWNQLKQLRHGANIQTIEINGKKLHFKNGPELLHGLDEIFVDEVYDLGNSNPSYIIDCGAHIGLSVLYLKEKYPNVKILAFEPDPGNYNLLKKNIDSYGFQDVEVRQEAIWTESTRITFSNSGDMSSRIDETGQQRNGIEIQAVPLKNFLDKKIDFLKIDIEGAEYPVLKDIAPSLSQVDKLFLEYHGNYSQNNELIEILEIIRNAGFRFYIREANMNYKRPFNRVENPAYDIQLNIFCTRH